MIDILGRAYARDVFSECQFAPEAGRKEDSQNNLSRVSEEVDRLALSIREEKKYLDQLTSSVEEQKNILQEQKDFLQKEKDTLATLSQEFKALHESSAI